LAARCSSEEYTLGGGKEWVSLVPKIGCESVYAYCMYEGNVEFVVSYLWLIPQSLSSPVNQVERFLSLI
jgi:hypothetical protein